MATRDEIGNMVRKSLLGILAEMQQASIDYSDFVTKKRGEGALEEDLLSTTPKDTATRSRGESAMEENIWE